MLFITSSEAAAVFLSIEHFARLRHISCTTTTHLLHSCTFPLCTAGLHCYKTCLAPVCLHTHTSLGHWLAHTHRNTYRNIFATYVFCPLILSCWCPVSVKKNSESVENFFFWLGNMYLLLCCMSLIHTLSSSVCLIQWRNWQ